MKPLDYSKRKILSAEYDIKQRIVLENDAPGITGVVTIRLNTSEGAPDGSIISVLVSAETPADPKLSEVRDALLSEAIAVLKRTGDLKLDDLL